MKNDLITPLIIIVLFIFFNNTLTGQKRGLVYRQASSIDFMVGGDFGLRLIGGDESIPEVFEVMTKRNAYEDFRLSTRFGINYYHGIGERFSLKTGIRIANPGFSISSIDPIDPEQNINSISKVYDSNGTHYQFKYQMLVLPIGLKYIISERGNCNPYVEFGISTNFYRKTIIEGNIYESTSNKPIDQKTVIINEPISKTNFMGFVASGGDFALGRNLHGFSQLVARYQFNNLRPDSLISEKLINLGLEVGMRYILTN